MSNSLVTGIMGMSFNSARDRLATRGVENCDVYALLLAEKKNLDYVIHGINAGGEPPTMIARMIKHGLVHGTNKGKFWVLTQRGVDLRVALQNSRGIADQKIGDYADQVKGKTRRRTIDALIKMGFTEWDALVVKNAQQSQDVSTPDFIEAKRTHPNLNCFSVYRIQDQRADADNLDQHVEFINRLMRLGVVDYLPMSTDYILTPRGEKLRRVLIECWDKSDMWDVVEERLSFGTKPAKPTSQVPATGDTAAKMDIWDVDLDRDGIILSIRKIWRQWRSDEVIPTAMVPVIDGGVLKAQEGIRALDDKTYAAPRLADDDSWTEAAQRKQNDLYWEVPSAFWLNPGIYRDGLLNLLAAPTPAPEWWTPPVNEAQRVNEHVKDVVEASLKAPPKPPAHFTEKVKPVMSQPSNARMVNTTFNTVIRTTGRPAKLPCGCPGDAEIKRWGNSAGSVVSCVRCGAMWEPMSNDPTGRRLAQGEMVRRKKDDRHRGFKEHYKDRGFTIVEYDDEVQAFDSEAEARKFVEEHRLSEQQAKRDRKAKDHEDLTINQLTNSQIKTLVDEMNRENKKALKEAEEIKQIQDLWAWAHFE